MTTTSGVSRSKTCRKCGVEKLIDAFSRDKRTPDGYACTCIDCRGNGKGQNGKSKRAAKAQPAPEPAPIANLASLEVLPGFGFRASIEDDRLSIEQDRDDGTADSITLSRTEAKVLFAQFMEWAA